jgi:hypothetical protein
MSKPKSSHRVFSRAFKLGIVNRMLAGENLAVRYTSDGCRAMNGARQRSHGPNRRHSILGDRSTI